MSIIIGAWEIGRIHGFDKHRDNWLSLTYHRNGYRTHDGALEEITIIRREHIYQLEMAIQEIKRQQDMSRDGIE